MTLTTKEELEFQAGKESGRRYALAQVRKEVAQFPSTCLTGYDAEKVSVAAFRNSMSSPLGARP